MALPAADLRKKIDEELEKNPVLEVVRDKTVVSLEAAEGERPQEEYDYFSSSSDPGFTHWGTAADADAAQQFLEGAVSRSETLQDHLLWQLRLQPGVEENLRAVAELCIQNLDDDGFHVEPPQTLVKDEALRCLLPQALALVQTLDPQGCATASWHESLAVQASLRFDAKTSAVITALLERLPDLQKERYEALSASLHISGSEAERCAALLKTLSPFPGRVISSEPCRYVTPDVKVTRREGQLFIIINNEEIPVIRVRPFFAKTGDTSQKPAKGAGEEKKAAYTFAKENVNEARLFIQAIRRRQNTLAQVTRAIVRRQRAFFEQGPSRLVPLTLNDVAREVEMHPATVSRAASGKYMQTEWGIFELRHFFTNSISGSGSGGSVFSKEGVKAQIREIVTQSTVPLTDQAIADALSARGVTIARRTAAKYRKELNLESSYGQK